MVDITILGWVTNQLITRGGAPHCGCNVYTCYSYQGHKREREADMIV